MYLALYARRAWVIFDHPYNTDSARWVGGSITAVGVRADRKIGDLSWARGSAGGAGWHRR